MTLLDADTDRSRPADPPADPPGEDAAAVVGIGASAGGLDALRLFFEHVPAGSGMAYVVIMHLDRERESRIASILQNWTPMPVAQVTKRTRVAADHVYVIPPDKDLTMQGDGSIEVVERDGSAPHSPVNLFFDTLATSLGGEAIGVVLSGTGEDGTIGIRRIKEGGGITVAQVPEEAEYDGMPRSAISSDHVDLIAGAASVPAELVRLREGPSPLYAGLPVPKVEKLLTQIFAALRGRTGHEFGLYKRATVLRRLERRLRFNGLKSLKEYLPLLRSSEAESRALVRDLLISVSGFFRDPEAFDALSGVIPSLFEGKGPDDVVRVWVVGCATGEEAYSIAILLAEHASTLEQPPRIQMFATDIDEKGYARGREALYPASALANLPAERLRRFFYQESGGYRVEKPLREGVLFAVHNVLHDPPFSRLDLISCRNLLIYLQPEAQEQVIETFHYALQPGGVLFLGAAESAGERGLFVAVAEPHRIYRRDARPHRVPPRLSTADPPARRAPRSDGGEDALAPTDFSYGARHVRLLEAYAPPSLIVNEQMEIVHLSAQASEFLHQGAGAPSNNLMGLVPAAVRKELRTALYQAFEKGRPDIRRIRANGGQSPEMSIRVYPSGDGEHGRVALVVFDAETPVAAGVATARGSSPPAAGLEEELRRTKEQLESTSAAHDDVVQALESANAELRSTNEEERASAEELETSREEIQSINEELTTINQEHQTTIEELKRTNADLQNLMESTEIGTIFVDREMRIRRFTPSVGSLFNFVASDRGRPLAHITHRLDYPELTEDARSVLGSRERMEREVTSDSGEWYIVRISPYRAADEGIDGAVLTFFNITSQKQVEEELREATLAAEAANLAKGTFLATLSHEFRTPLNGMLGYADLLDIGGSLTDDQRQRVERIKAGGRHLASMIDEILTFAKLDAGREIVNFETVDARELARQAGDLVEPGAEAKGLRFVLDLPDEPIQLETDPGKLRQIILNLCGNAVKYTEHGEVRLLLRADDDRVVIEVRDTGIGISAEHQSHVFERFWQVDGGSTRMHEGMGIGLAAAHEFTRLLGGDVELESEHGQGSTFRLWLPRARTPA